MKFKQTYLLYCVLMLFFSFSTKEKSKTSRNTITCLTTKTTYEAGEPIVLTFSISSEIKTPPYLYCYNAYGATLIKPRVGNKLLEYTFPEIITRKTGVVNWSLPNKRKSLNGSVEISPKQEAVFIDTFIGPPSVEVGKTNFTMYVAIPVDRYDNPVAANTEVAVKTQYKEIETEYSILTKHLLAYQTIYSEEKSGRILIGSECLHLDSKESTVNVMPFFPSDFEIFEDKHHSYADGNQIVVFTTSVIKDEYENVVSNGTYVEFVIITNEGVVLKTSGATINGVAKAKIIHPDHASDWKVTAVVDRMANSNELSISFKPVMEEIIASFSKDNRTIIVGPIKSYMNQLIPDGIHVELSVLKNNKAINTQMKTSIDGYATFTLEPDIFKNDTYQIQIKMANMEKEFKAITLW